MQPLIEKYQIDPEANTLFQSIIRMFDGKPNYQVWGVKVIFSKAINIDQLKEIKEWADTYSQSITQLSKQNITSYTCKTHFSLLRREMAAIKMVSFLKNQFMQFNTEQKKMLNDQILAHYDNLEKVYSSIVLKNWVSIFEKFDKLSPGRKQNFHSNCSAIKNSTDLMAAIENAIQDSYTWNREDFLAYMENNTSGCEVVVDRDNILVVKIPSFEASKTLCGNGRTQWCITTGADHWRRYVTNYGSGAGKREQFFLFDFNKRETDELAHVGFTIESGKGIDLAYSNTDRDIKSGYIDYKFPDEPQQHVNIYKCLSKLNLDLSSFMTMKKAKYEWVIDSIVDLIVGHEPTKGTIVYNNNNIIVAQIDNTASLKLLIDHTFINPSSISFDANTTNFVMFDLNKEGTKNDAIICLMYKKDIYGTLSAMRTIDALGVEANLQSILKDKGLKENDFLNNNEIDKRILLHKYIDTMDEESAINLVKEEGPDFDINYEFNQRTPVFNAIANRMYKLFRLLVEHPKFNAMMSDGFGETLLESLVFQYGLKDDLITEEERANIGNLINEILESEEYNFNCLDMNDDTALNVSCEYPEMNWITEKLLAKPNIVINQVNFFGLTAIGSAITYHNTGAIEMLAKRPDLMIRPIDLKIAEAEGIKLDEFVDINAHLVEEKEATSASS